MLHILHHHQGDLECQGVIKGPDVKAHTLLQLLYTVYQRISVHIELACRLRHIQIIFKKLIYSGDGLFIQIIRNLFTEDLMHEHLAQTLGQLIYEPSYAQSIIGIYASFGIKDAAHLGSHTRLLIGAGHFP